MQKRHELHAKAGAPVFSSVVALARGKSRLETVTWRTSVVERRWFQASRDQAIATGNKRRKEEAEKQKRELCCAIGKTKNMKAV